MRIKYNAGKDQFLIVADQTVNIIPMDEITKQKDLPVVLADYAHRHPGEWCQIGADGMIRSELRRLKSAHTISATNGDSVRVLRIIEYTGRRDLVEQQIEWSVTGTKILPNGLVIRAATIGTYPEILESGENRQGDSREEVQGIMDSVKDEDTL